MQTFVTIIHVIVSVFMMLVILLQEGKSGMGAIGGGSGATPFGARGRSTPLSKATAIAAATFMFTSMALAWMSSSEQSVITDEIVQEAPGLVPATQADEAADAQPTGEVGPPAEAPVEGMAEEADEAPATEGDEGVEE